MNNIFRLGFTVATTLFLFFNSVITLTFGGNFEIEIDAGDHTRNHSIATFHLPQKLEDANHFSLIRKEDQKRIPSQVQKEGKQKKLYWILEKELPANQKRSYIVEYDTRPDQPSTLPTNLVQIRNEQETTTLFLGDKPVMVYRHATVPSPIKEAPYYARSGYLHPVYTPAGSVITDDFNPDHPHQHGIMFAWRKLIFEGRSTNGWDQKEQTGQIVHSEIKSFSSGPVLGTLKVELNHDDLTAEKSPKTMLKETWQIRLFAIKDYFLFEIESEQSCATDKPVLVEKYHYGGMTLRASSQWTKPESSEFLTSEGKTRSNGNHTRPNWVHTHGTLDNQRAGITIFSHPGNFRSPQPVRLHPKMPYFCFVPAQLGEFQIEREKPYISKYRYCISSGKPDTQLIEQLWNDYASPLEAKVR